MNRFLSLAIIISLFFPGVVLAHRSFDPGEIGEVFPDYSGSDPALDYMKKNSSDNDDEAKNTKVKHTNNQEKKELLESGNSKDRKTNVRKKKTQPEKKDFQPLSEKEKTLDNVNAQPEKEVLKDRENSNESSTASGNGEVESDKAAKNDETIVEQQKEQPLPVEASEQKASDTVTLDAVTVRTERPLSAASDQTVRNKDFMSYPRKTASDLLRFIPGLHITQHTGGAKAHQIFLRGFDAEHGQDVAAFIDGIPLNEPSQVHGQGYLDLHFLLPESIKRIWVMKGPYDPRYGNFSTAGVIDFIPYITRGFKGSVAVSGETYSGAEGFGGRHGGKLLGQAAFDWLSQDSYLVMQADFSEGYTEPGELAAGRALFHHRVMLAERLELRLLYAGYGARSEAADILPLRMIEDNEISRFAALDDSNRVDVDRHLLGLTLDWTADRYRARLQGYYNYKTTEIFSNYTFYYFNEQEGDQIEQSEERHYGGLKGYFRASPMVGEVEFRTEVGFDVRTDDIDQTQANTDNRKKVNVLNSYDFLETSFGVYLDERITVTRWFRLMVGFRFDNIWFEGDGIQDVKTFDVATNGSKILQDTPVSFDTSCYALSPKASAIFTPFDEWSIFLNFGRGFVSSQARQLANFPDDTAPEILAAEAGTRVKLWEDRVTFSLSGWWAEKESEMVFDSEFGMNIPRGRSRRIGGDIELRITPIRWLSIGSDLFYVDARFIDEDTRIPNMAEWMMTNHIGLHHPSGVQASLRGRFVGPRYHDMEYESDAYYVVDVQLGYRFDPIRVTIAVENLFNTVWYDSVYAYPSRPEKDGVIEEGLHVTPGAPLTARIELEARF